MNFYTHSALTKVQIALMVVAILIAVVLSIHYGTRPTPTPRPSPTPSPTPSPAPTPTSTPTPTPTPTPNISRVEIGTFYYVWYDFDDRISWEYPKICDKPALGYYDSCDVGIIKQHFDWFSDLFLDFIIVSYWGHYNQTRWNQFVLNATHQIFKTAKENGTNIKICVMVEPFNQTENPKYHYQEILNYVYNNFIAPYHTLYYNYQGKPLICFSNDPYLTPNGNIPKDENFTVKIVGQESYADWIYTDLIPIAGPIPRNGQIPVTPRFDDSRFRTPSNVVDKDLSEGVYDEQWKRAVDCVRNGTVNVITISSWNEYPERTAIEPHWDADAYDPNPYLLYDKTRRYIVELKDVDAELNLLKRAKELAYSYLTNSYNSTLGLCYEHPGLKNVSWIANDNVLASYVLQKWNRNLADNITEAIRRIANEYSLLTSQNGLPLNCRAEILLGYNVSVFFNKTELVTLNPNYNGSLLKTEKATNEVMTDFEDYADLLCYASLVEWTKENGSGADAEYYYGKFKAMWDGNGFKDKAFEANGYYATYKLGLFYFLNKKLDKGPFEFEKELIQEVWQCQDANGGFKTDYYANGSFPPCCTNTETTSIILLADVPCQAG